MSENQVSNNLELHPPTLRENYKISNLKWNEFFFASVDREQKSKLAVWKRFRGCLAAWNNYEEHG